MVLALAAIAAIYLARASRQARTPSYPPNAFYEVKRADMLVSVMEDGALRALNETVIRNALDGVNRIIQLAREGSHVKKGDLLVELDSSILKERLNEQELSHQDRLFQYMQAQGNLKIQKSLAESQIKDAELVVENAKADLEKYRDGDAPLLIKIVEARIGVLSEQVRIATERLARTEVLFQEGNSTRSEFEADSLTLKREQLALSQYQEDLRLIKKFDQPNQVQLLQSKVEEAEKELERLKQRTASEIAQAEADLKTSQRSVAFLEESIATQKERLGNAKIFAPQDGLVVYATANPFQSMGDGGEARRDEGRFRGGRGGGGGGFRGGGGRGGRSSSQNSGGSLSSSSSSGSAAQAVASANQRAASAESGTTAGGAASGGGGASQANSARGGGGGSGGGDAQNASRSFATYASMRPSSTIPASSSSGGSSGQGSTTSGGSSSGSSISSGGQESSMGFNTQSSFRSQSSFGFSGYESGTSGFVEEGMMVRQRQELIRLPDVSKMLAEIKIHESRVRQVKPGMMAYVRIENIPNRRFKGTVRKIAPLPDSQMSWMNPDLKVYPTDVLIEEELPELKPGVSARAEIIITNLSKVLTVPIHTVTRLKGENVCFIKKGSGVTHVPVTTGWFNDQFVEITSGLKEGDRVLLAPVGDEQIGSEPEEANEVEAVAEPRQETAAPRQETAMPRDPESAGETATSERRRPRGNGDSAESDRPAERRRSRPETGRRPQNSQEASE